MLMILRKIFDIIAPMKNKILLVVAALLAAVFVVGCSSSKEIAKPKSLKVLTIGNSFSICLQRYMPECAKAAGVKLDIVSAYIGGCSLERHWKNIEKASDANFRPYVIDWSYDGVRNGKDATVAKALNGKRTSNIPEILKADKWDIVTIQQASHYSWQPETYYPYADNLIKTIRELAPQAEIRIQQTWAYCNADNRIYGRKTWGFDQAEMYNRLTGAYKQLAEKHNLKIIPMGLAVQTYRTMLPVTFVPPSAEELNNFKAPAVPNMGGEVVGNYYWGKQKKSKEKTLRCDSIHLNREGEYLQACVWVRSLFGVDVENLPFTPEFGEEFKTKRAPVIRAAAQKAGCKQP